MLVVIYLETTTICLQLFLIFSQESARIQTYLIDYGTSQDLSDYTQSMEYVDYYYHIECQCHAHMNETHCNWSQLWIERESQYETCR